MQTARGKGSLCAGKQDTDGAGIQLEKWCPGRLTYNQISVPVTFDSDNGSTVRFTVPSNPNLLQPGFYMVFLISTDNVPSVAMAATRLRATPPIVAKSPPT